MASTDLGRRFVLVWPLLLTGLMALQSHGKYRLGKKICSGTAPFTDWTDGPAKSWQVQTREEDWFWYDPFYRLD
jgi:hypothetical protein